MVFYGDGLVKRRSCIYLSQYSLYEYPSKVQPHGNTQGPPFILISLPVSLPGAIDAWLIYRYQGYLSRLDIIGISYTTLWASLVAQMGKNCLQCRRPGFDPWVRKIPQRREWQPTPVFLPGESHGQKSLVGYGVAKNWTWLTLSLSLTHTYTHYLTEARTGPSAICFLQQIHLGSNMGFYGTVPSVELMKGLAEWS